MLVRFCVDYRIKPHVPPFEQIPANSVKFQSCNYTPQVEYLALAYSKNLLKYSYFKVWTTRVPNPIRYPYFNVSIIII